MKSLLFICACAFAFTWAYSPQRGARVIGGSTVVTGQFPFVAAIHISTSQGRYFCGGTLISNQWVVTAAQCAQDAVLFSIQLGSHTLTKDDSNRVTVASSEYFIHPDFNPDTLENDIALIELRLPVEFSNYLLAIHSLAQEPLNTSSAVIVTGWGQTSDADSALSENLQFVRVTTLSNEECRLTYGNQIYDTMVCVDGNYNEGSCNGDTGGPLINVVSMGNAQLVGVASFVSGNGCESTDPSGYTRVYPYVGWIKNVTGLAF
ncbi:hypothetical protein Zmor_015481 [Zophobas morio]|uniref:Peptidase S1 domain-containing protein n=1 Tax=Zophobas morio TaxID=2755281 RepID=A0AA38IH52_9CUCU|nr:hypothetical protein Zmor_015481 [Zophobas morio]